MCFVASLAQTFLATIEKAILPHSNSSPFLYVILRHLAPQYLPLQKSLVLQICWRPQVTSEQQHIEHCRLKVNSNT